MRTLEVKAATWEAFCETVRIVAKKKGETVCSLFGMKALAGSKDGYTRTKYIWSKHLM